MQTLKLDTLYYTAVDFNLSPLKKSLVKKGIEDVSYLFQVEDSTAQEIMALQRYGAPPVNRIRDTVKAVFWMVVAIAIPLVIGL